MKAEARSGSSSSLQPCKLHRKVRVLWLFRLRKLSQASAFYSPAPPVRALPWPFVMLWLHLQPEQGASALGVSMSSGGVEHRLTAISTNKVFSSRCTVYSTQTWTVLEVIYSDCVYNNSCSEYTRTSLAKIGLESLF